MACKWKYVSLLHLSSKRLVGLSDQSSTHILQKIPTIPCKHYSKLHNSVFSNFRKIVLNTNCLVERAYSALTYPNVASIRVEELSDKEAEDVINNLCEQDFKKLEMLKLQFDFLKTTGEIIPERMTDKQWIETMQLTSDEERLSYFRFLRITENKRKKAKLSKPSEHNPDFKPMHGYEHGRIFFRITDKTMNKIKTSKLVTAMQFGLPLVIDMDYVKEMSDVHAIKNTAKQLLLSYASNRNNQQPFNFVFTGCEKDNRTFRLFDKYMISEDYIITRTSKSYLDLYNKEELVYLSPNARNEMYAFDPNSVYIVGGFNDKRLNYESKQLSYARAMEQGIKCQKLPLDKYLLWKQGSKTLTVNCVVDILLSLKNTGSWNEAFKRIPRRLVHTNEEILEKAKRNIKGR